MSNNVQILQHLRVNLIHPRRLAAEELLDYLSILCPGYGQAFLRVFRLCLLYGGRVGRVQEFLKVLFPPLDDISSPGLQFSCWTQPESSNGFPEPPWGQPKVLLHGPPWTPSTPGFFLFWQQPTDTRLLLHETSGPTKPKRPPSSAWRCSSPPALRLPPRKAATTFQPQLLAAASTRFWTWSMNGLDRPSSLWLCSLAGHVFVFFRT